MQTMTAAVSALISDIDRQFNQIIETQVSTANAPADIGRSNAAIEQWFSNLRLVNIMAIGNAVEGYGSQRYGDAKKAVEAGGLFQPMYDAKPGDKPVLFNGGGVILRGSIGTPRKTIDKAALETALLRVGLRAEQIQDVMSSCLKESKAPRSVEVING